MKIPAEGNEIFQAEWGDLAKNLQSHGHEYNEINVSGICI